MLRLAAFVACSALAAPAFPFWSATAEDSIGTTVLPDDGDSFKRCAASMCNPSYAVVGAAEVSGDIGLVRMAVEGSGSSAVYSARLDGFNADYTAFDTLSMRYDYRDTPAGNAPNFAGSWLEVGPNLFVGELTLLGAHPLVNLSLYLATSATADFSHTAVFAFDVLPAGTAFTSASGLFLSAAAVPEPASLACFMAGLALLAALRLRRAR